MSIRVDWLSRAELSRKIVPTSRGAVGIVGERGEFLWEKVSERSEKAEITTMSDTDRTSLRLNLNSAEILVFGLL